MRTARVPEVKHVSPEGWQQSSSLQLQRWLVDLGKLLLNGNMVPALCSIFSALCTRMSVIGLLMTIDLVSFLPDCSTREQTCCLPGT